MPITERTLKKWRKQALVTIKNKPWPLYEELAQGLARSHEECQERILRMTQELLDQHMLSK